MSIQSRSCRTVSKKGGQKNYIVSLLGQKCLTSEFLTLVTSWPVNINDIPTLLSCNVNLISPLIWHEHSYFLLFLVTEKERNLSNSPILRLFSRQTNWLFQCFITMKRSSMPLNIPQIRKMAFSDFCYNCQRVYNDDWKSRFVMSQGAVKPCNN